MIETLQLDVIFVSLEFMWNVINNHIDYKYLQGSNEPWDCLSCCSKIFPFGKQTNKDFISSITATNLFSQGTIGNKESLLSLKPPSDLVLPYNQFTNTSPEKTMPLKMLQTPYSLTLTKFNLYNFLTNTNLLPYFILMHAL